MGQRCPACTIVGTDIEIQRIVQMDIVGLVAQDRGRRQARHRERRRYQRGIVGAGTHGGAVGISRGAGSTGYVVLVPSAVELPNHLRSVNGAGHLPAVGWKRVTIKVLTEAAGSAECVTGRGAGSGDGQGKVPRLITRERQVRLAGVVTVERRGSR